MKIPALREIIEERKEKAIEDLSASFAKNRLPLEEYERLVEYINKIESERELVVVEKMVAEYGAVSEAGTEALKENSYDDDDEPDYYDENRSYSFGSLSVLSARTYSGPVKSGTQFTSILGSGQIKIRKTDLSKRRTSLHVVSILGDNTIFVESGIKVINKTIPVLGSSSVNQKVNKHTQADGPELIISGLALLGDISVKLLRE